MKSTKTADMFQHAKSRFRVRFDINLTEHLQREIVKQIVAGETTFVEKQSNSISRHRLTVQGRVVDVIYDRERRAIRTVLYPDEIEE